jgi:hypothetical protein
MADKRLAMYDEFSDTGKHFTEWVRITKVFSMLAFAGGRREASSCVVGVRMEGCYQSMRCLHRCDRVAGYDPSYGVQIKVQLLELVPQRYREVDY